MGQREYIESPENSFKMNFKFRKEGKFWYVYRCIRSQKLELDKNPKTKFPLVSSFPLVIHTLIPYS
jgi:hypothetical protein